MELEVDLERAEPEGLARALEVGHLHAGAGGFGQFGLESERQQVHDCPP